MPIKDLIPWKARRTSVPSPYREPPSLFTLHREMNRVFDDLFQMMDRFFSDRELPSPFVGRGGFLREETFVPRVNVSETEEEFRVSAELPGLTEKDVRVELEDNVLTIQGERKEEHDEKGCNWHRVEQCYGHFYRQIPLSGQVNPDKVRAKFKNGVLTVTIPKLEPDTRNRRTVEIVAE